MHPAAWWVWAAGVVVARGPVTLDPPCSACSGRRPWAWRVWAAAPERRRSPGTSLLGLGIVVVRVVFHVLVGLKARRAGSCSTCRPGSPPWAPGVELLGPVTAAGLAGAARRRARGWPSWCSPSAPRPPRPRRPGCCARCRRRCTTWPPRLAIAVAVAPSLVRAAGAARRARRLRGLPDRGPRALAESALPVLADALDRAVDLAASMDVRGYARLHRPRRPSGALPALVGALLASAVGTVRPAHRGPGLRRPGAGRRGRSWGAGGALLAGRGARRTRYRPDPWRGPGVARRGRRARSRWSARSPAGPRRRSPRRRGRSGSAPSCRFRGPRRWRHDPPRARERHLPGRERPPTLRDVDVSGRRGRAVPGGRDPRAPASRPSCAPSAAWCRTSPAAPLAGRVLVDGRDTRDHRPRDLADVVGVVLQDPARGFVTETVEDELAYAMEQLGLPPATMRARMEEVLDLLGLARSARRPAARPVRRRAAARGDRGRAHRPPARPGARRADLRARPARRRRRARGADPARARPRHDGAAGRAPAGARGAVRGPGARRGTGRHGARRGRRRAARARRLRATAGRAGPARRVGARRRCRSATPGDGSAPLRARLAALASAPAAGGAPVPCRRPTPC